jgi:hypothetical protein
MKERKKESFIKLKLSGSAGIASEQTSFKKGIL